LDATPRKSSFKFNPISCANNYFLSSHARLIRRAVNLLTDYPTKMHSVWGDFLFLAPENEGAPQKT
jgi:hypothetical protein